MHFFLKILTYLFILSPDHKIVCALYIKCTLWPTLRSVYFLWFLSRKIYKITSKAFGTQDSTIYRTIFIELLTLAINALVSPFTSLNYHLCLYYAFKNIYCNHWASSLPVVCQVHQHWAFIHIVLFTPALSLGNCKM